MHAPEADCIGTGNARNPYKIGVKTSISVTHKGGLMVRSCIFPGKPYDLHILSAQLEQTGILLDDVGRSAKVVVVVLGLRGVDHDDPDVEIIHLGKYNPLTAQQCR